MIKLCCWVKQNSSLSQIKFAIPCWAFNSPTQRMTNLTEVYIIGGCTPENVHRIIRWGEFGDILQCQVGIYEFYMMSLPPSL